MLSEAKHLAAEHERPFAAAQGDREGKHLIASLPMEREPFKILTAETLDKLAKVFGVDASELIERCTG